MVVGGIEGCLRKRQERAVDYDLDVLKAGAGRYRPGMIDGTDELADDLIAMMWTTSFATSNR